MGDYLNYDSDETEREAAIYSTPRRDSAVGWSENSLILTVENEFSRSAVAPVTNQKRWHPTSGQEEIHAIDRSAAMLDLARDRCELLSQVSLTAADATALPIADGSIDAATAVQVYEYVEHLESAPAELVRVLRPGGRAVVYDTDFASIVW